MGRCNQLGFYLPLGSKRLVIAIVASDRPPHRKIIEWKTSPGQLVPFFAAIAIAVNTLSSRRYEIKPFIERLRYRDRINVRFHTLLIHRAEAPVHEHAP